MARGENTGLKSVLFGPSSPNVISSGHLEVNRTLPVQLITALVDALHDIRCKTDGEKGSKAVAARREGAGEICSRLISRSGSRRSAAKRWKPETREGNRAYTGQVYASSFVESRLQPRGERDARETLGKADRKRRRSRSNRSVHTYIHTALSGSRRDARWKDVGRASETYASCFWSRCVRGFAWLCVALRNSLCPSRRGERTAASRTMYFPRSNSCILHVARVNPFPMNERTYVQNLIGDRSSAHCLTPV